MKLRNVTVGLLAVLVVGCDAGPDGSAGEAGQDGALGSTGMEGLSGDDGYAVLSEFTEVEEARFGCEEGYRVTRIGVDDGAEGGVAGDATLQDGEVDVTLTECLTRN
jgi:hypothetical protein